MSTLFNDWIAPYVRSEMSQRVARGLRHDNQLETQEETTLVAMSQMSQGDQPQEQAEPEASLEPAPDWWPARRQKVRTIELVRFCCRCGTRIEGDYRRREDGEPMHLEGECWNDRVRGENA